VCHAVDVHDEVLVATVRVLVHLPVLPVVIQVVEDATGTVLVLIHVTVTSVVALLIGEVLVLEVFSVVLLIGEVLVLEVFSVVLLIGEVLVLEVFSVVLLIGEVLVLEVFSVVLADTVVRDDLEDKAVVVVLADRAVELVVVVPTTPPQLPTGSMVFVSKVTAAVSAYRPPPFRVTLVVAVIETWARMLPRNAVPVPSVAEDPTCQ
jgi:hypothetical protein